MKDNAYPTTNRVYQLFTHLCKESEMTRRRVLESEPNHVACEVKRLLLLASNCVQPKSLKALFPTPDPIEFSEVPKEIGGYVLVEEIGRGGMGVVYKAAKHGGAASFAVKLIASDADRRDWGRFVQESQVICALRHPNIVPAIAMGEHEGRPYLVMEFIPGRDLLKHVSETGPMHCRVVKNIISQVAEGLAEAHERQIVHRDIKPQNVLLEWREGKEHVRIVDFGICRCLDRPGLTRPGGIRATWEFAAPEQIVSAETVTPAADIYSLGLLMVYLLTGGGVARTGNPHVNWEMIARLLDGAPSPFELHSILKRMLSAIPSERPTARELVRLLKELRGETISSEGVTSDAPASLELSREANPYLPLGIVRAESKADCTEGDSFVNQSKESVRNNFPLSSLPSAGREPEGNSGSCFEPIPKGNGAMIEAESVNQLARIGADNIQTITRVLEFVVATIATWIGFRRLKKYGRAAFLVTLLGVITALAVASWVLLPKPPADQIPTARPMVDFAKAAMSIRELPDEERKAKVFFVVPKEPEYTAGLNLVGDCEESMSEILAIMARKHRQPAGPVAQVERLKTNGSLMFCVRFSDVFGDLATDQRDEIWDFIQSRNPYGLTPADGPSQHDWQDLCKWTGREIPIVRLDWFLAQCLDDRHFWEKLAPTDADLGEAAKRIGNWYLRQEFSLVELAGLLNVSNETLARAIREKSELSRFRYLFNAEGRVSSLKLQRDVEGAGSSQFHLLARWSHAGNPDLMSQP